MSSLSAALRRQLESAVLAARRASEGASRASIAGLGVFADRRPEHLGVEQASLRNGLRAKWRQLGEDDAAQVLLIAECAYEQWHRLLFARFLAENGLLLHPRYKASVSVADCEELAADLGEPDGWSVAARFAAEILPGIFRLDDPCVRLRLAPEGRHDLEQILGDLPVEVFTADDSLGWVYQFWQKDKKDEVNASERKIGGADLGPVTQLFTENYMVRFLLENSLGAWWSVRHPASPLLKGFEYLRLDEDGNPAAGSFDGWPDRVAEVTVMDPCCGSGHFLVEAFSMLWQMRAEEEGLAPVEAQDAVLGDNLFGLELDARCVQIATFAVALQAWKAGGGWRQLPLPNIACSGIPIKAPVDEWKALADGDQRLESALVRLHILFRDADTIGSLIDPKRATKISDPTGLQGSMEDVDWDEVAPLLESAVAAENRDFDPGELVLGLHVNDVARAARLLSHSYTLVSTNVPYLHRGKQADPLLRIGEQLFADSSADLATMIMDRSFRSLDQAGAIALVAPQNWMSQTGYTSLRDRLLRSTAVRFIARLGEGAFESPAAAGAFVALYVLQNTIPTSNTQFSYLDAAWRRGIVEKIRVLESVGVKLRQSDQRDHPDCRIHPPLPGGDRYLFDYAVCLQGIKTGDDGRFRREYWELPAVTSQWAPFLSSVDETLPFGGRSGIVLWEQGVGTMASSSGSRIVGKNAWNRHGVHISQMRELPVTLYRGELFDTNASPIIPRDEALVPAIWAFCASAEYAKAVREIEPALKVTNATLVKVPFDVARWRRVAEEADPLPEPWSDDPTQWLFEGRPEVSTAPLQVAVGRLVGYRWPEQAESDDLDEFADADGIVCLPSVAGEATAADRVQQVLAAAFGDAWSPARVKDLLERAGSKKVLSDWLRDEFFKQHCGLFGNRPFVWHIWDGQRDGFSALVNYHRLDRKMLQKLTYTYLGQDWVERQRADVREEVPGAEGRLAAALKLQRKLEAILDGEKPFDMFVRWKGLDEQPIGWEPDLNDGVRLNIRPFVEAGVLRGPVNIHWRKDRGRNPDGSERHNDLHLSLAEKLDARKRTGIA